MVCVGILALQGDFAAHSQVLEALQVPWQLVKTPDELARVDGLIIPGGESTTLLKLMATSGLQPALQQFHAQGRPVFGTCAGLILLARETRQPAQESLGFIDLVAIRNAYGRQVDSFVAPGTPLLPEALGTPPLPMVFIRAPKIGAMGARVSPLASCGGEIVLAQQGRVLVATFHPELTSDRRVHAYFLRLVQERSAAEHVDHPAPWLPSRSAVPTH
jgi:pyridoxal 5'-phosphate synthase pdxT subunit